MAISETGCKIASEVRDLLTVGMLKRAFLGALAGYSITLLAGDPILWLGIGSGLSRLFGIAGLGIALVALGRLGSCGSDGDCDSSDCDCS